MFTTYAAATGVNISIIYFSCTSSSLIHCDDITRPRSSTAFGISKFLNSTICLKYSLLNTELHLN